MRVWLGIKRRPALAVALLVFALAAIALGLSQHQAPLAVPRQVAIRAALHSRLTKQSLSGAHWSSITVSPIDRTLTRVSFFDHGQILAQVAVTTRGQVVLNESFTHRAVPYGDWIAYQPGLLIGLAFLFVLLAGVAPWRRVRNLDVVAALTLVAPVVLLQHRYVDASVISAFPALAYFLGRCLSTAVGEHRPAAPSTPVLDVLTPQWDARRRVRLLRLMLGGMAVIFALVTISSPVAVDVVYAVMEGATKIASGVLPYGHLPGDVVHGDTYPLLSFVLYTPLAWAAPVRSIWDPVDLALGAAAVAALLAGWALFRSVGGNQRRGQRPPEVEAAGLRAALLWLAFPPVLAAVSSGTTDVVLAAMVIFAVLLWRRPGLSTGLLVAGAWFKLAPLALIPARLAPLRGRSLARGLIAIAVVSLPLLGLLVALGGLSGPAAMIHAVAFQFSRGSPQSIWSALGIPSLQPVGEAGALGLIAGSAVRLRVHPELQDDRTRVAALSAAILVALELAAGYWAFLYLLWIVPLLAASVLSARPEAVKAAEPAFSSLGAPAPGVVVA